MQLKWFSLTYTASISIVTFFEDDEQDDDSSSMDPIRVAFRSPHLCFMTTGDKEDEQDELIAQLDDELIAPSDDEQDDALIEVPTFSLRVLAPTFTSGTISSVTLSTSIVSSSDAPPHPSASGLRRTSASCPQAGRTSSFPAASPSAASSPQRSAAAATSVVD